MGLSRSQYTTLSSITLCPSWKSMQQAGRALLPFYDAAPNVGLVASSPPPPAASVEVFGLRGERSGIVIDPEYNFALWLRERSLVEGVQLVGRTAPRPPERVGIVFEPQPQEVFIIFSDMHSTLFEDTEQPAVAVAMYFAKQLDVPQEAFAPSPDLMPRLSWTRSPMGGALEAPRRSAILTVPSEAHQRSLKEASARLFCVVITGRVLNVEVGLKA